MFEQIGALIESGLGWALLIGVHFMAIVGFVALSLVTAAYTAKLIWFALDWRNTDRREALDLIIATPIMAFGACGFGAPALHFLAEIVVWARA